MKAQRPTELLADAAECWISRAHLRETPAISAVAGLLLAPGASHNLVWSLFAAEAGDARRFLYREEAPGRFITLSAAPPADPHGLWEIESKPFAPDLKVGDHLRFVLRANPTVNRGPDHRPARRDLVMDRIHALQGAARNAARGPAVWEAGIAWLRQQAARCGFTIDPALSAEAPGEFRFEGYRQTVVPRRRGKEQGELRLSSMDMSGLLVVEEPDLFLRSLRRGIGRAGAYGCGLMLIRRP